MDLVSKYMGEAKGKQPFKVGDKVKVAGDALKKHSRSTPASMGYTQATMDWRSSIDSYKGKVGTVTQIFASGNTDVDFGKGIIMMDASMLVKA